MKRRYGTLLLFSFVIVVGLSGCITASNATGDSTTTPTPTPDGANTTSSASTFDVKVALLKKYDPGTNRGMPSIVRSDVVNRTIRNHPQLAEKLQSEFGISDEQSTRLYTTIEQYQRIEIAVQDDSRYNFTVHNDNTCTIETITGQYDVDTGTVLNETRNSESVPC